MDGTLRRIGMSSVRCRYSEVGHSPCEISGTRDGTGRRRGLSARSRCRRRRRKTVCHLARFFGLFFFFHERYYDGTGPVAWRIGHAPGTRNGEENPSTWGGPECCSLSVQTPPTRDIRFTYTTYVHTDPSANSSADGWFANRRLAALLLRRTMPTAKLLASAHDFPGRLIDVGAPEPRAKQQPLCGRLCATRPLRLTGQQCRATPSFYASGGKPRWILRVHPRRPFPGFGPRRRAVTRRAVSGPASCGLTRFG